jgi:hypothetical protein
VGSRARSAWHPRPASSRAAPWTRPASCTPRKTNQKLAGWAAAEPSSFNLDAMLIQVLFVVLAVLGDSGLVL